MDKSHTRHSKNTIFLWLFLLIPFVKPVYFSQIESIDLAFNIWRIFNFLIVIWLLVLRKRVSVVSLVVVLWVCVNIISTYLNGGDPVKAISYAIVSFGAFSIIDLLMRKDIRLMFHVILPVFEALIYMNLLTLIMYPNGMFTLVQATGWKSDLSWFLGLRNGLTPWILIASMIATLNWYCNPKHRLRSLALISACSATVFLVNSATKLYSDVGTTAGGILAGWLLFTLYYFIPLNFKNSGKISFINAIVINIVFFFGIVIFRFQNVFSSLIEKGFKKNLTFTGRTGIWDHAISTIKNHPTIGVGFQSDIVMAENLKNIAAVVTTHNSFLDILYRGGLLSMCLFLLVIILIHRDLKSYYANKISAIIGMTVLVYFITGQFEGFTGVYLFILLAIASNSSSIVANYSNMGKPSLK